MKTELEIRKDIDPKELRSPEVLAAILRNAGRMIAKARKRIKNKAKSWKSEIWE